MNTPLASKQCVHDTLVRAKTGGWFCISTTGCEFSIPEPAETAGNPDEAAIYKAALERITKWFGEFPDTGLTWNDGSPMSYVACYGSNGERDFMRQLARVALEQGAVVARDAVKAEAPRTEGWPVECENCTARVVLPYVGSAKSHVDTRPADGWELYPRRLCPGCQPQKTSAPNTCDIRCFDYPKCECGRSMP